MVGVGEPSATHGSSGASMATDCSSLSRPLPGAPTVTSPSMRSTLKLRPPPRSFDQPARYQCPPESLRRTGSTVLASPR